MLTALILVCSLTTPDPGDCSRANAVHVMRVPAAFASPVTCFLHGQAYLAETTIGQDLAPNERVKVICVPNGAAIDVTGTLPTTAR
jgi:hypothetical protein